MTAVVWIVAAWLFVLGAMVGSFLNVVVYRLPAGQSIIYPGSRCPHCGRPIRWYHNLPILGWLVLRGRCYDCGAPISPRYPLVESAAAAGFLLLVGLVFFTSPSGPLPAMSDPRRWALYAAAAVLFSSLLVVALVRYDGQGVPRSIWLLAASSALLCLGLTWG